MFQQPKHLKIADRLQDIKQKETRATAQAVGSAPEMFKKIRTIHISAPVHVSSVSINIENSVNTRVAIAPAQRYETSVAVNAEHREEKLPTAPGCWPFSKCFGN